MIFEEALNIIEIALGEEQLLNEPAGLYEPMVYTLENGGKRLRPALAVMSASLFSLHPENAVKAALGLEIFHNFTLLHDDIMDKAPIRRGNPTVHEKWDDNTAILSGDAMLIKAYQYIAKVSVEKLPAVLEVFSQTALEVCEGQQYDMEFESQKDVSESEYLEMIRLKTAVLLGGSLKIGAIIGGADKEDQDALYEFGINLGLAFQLMDDWLDVYGDERTFGKKPGGDIMSNKKTFMLINALDRAKGNVHEKLMNYLNSDGFTRVEKVQGVTAIFNDLNIGGLAKQKMEDYYQKSMNALEKVNVEAAELNALRGLAQKMMKRTN